MISVVSFSSFSLYSVSLKLMFFSSHLSSSYLDKKGATFFWTSNFCCFRLLISPLLLLFDWWLSWVFMLIFTVFFRVVPFDLLRTTVPTGSFASISDPISSTFLSPQTKAATRYQLKRPNLLYQYFCLAYPFRQVLNEFGLVGRGLGFLCYSPHLFDLWVGGRIGFFLGYWRSFFSLGLCHNNKTDSRRLNHNSKWFWPNDFSEFLNVSVSAVYWFALWTMAMYEFTGS